MHKILRVWFGKQADFFLDFRIDDTVLANLWLEKMSIRHMWPMDNPDRFYGFNNKEADSIAVLKKINQLINIINSYEKIIDRDLVSIDDQDTLNYLHNIFEKYHGMLDAQNTLWWSRAPDSVKTALANLNIAVHKCESVSRKNLRRFVCTWWGMPKQNTLTQQIIESHGKETIDFGGVYLNYVEIGKTALDLSIDNDEYISDEMFKPFNYYSADFVVYMQEIGDKELEEQARCITLYFEKNRDFFAKQGIFNVHDYRIRPFKFKVAQLLAEFCNETTINKIAQHQHVHLVEII